MSIRKASVKDMNKCLEIEYPQTREKKEIFKNNFIRQVKKDDYLLLVAEINGEVMGFISCRKDAWNKLFYIEQLFIHEKQRGKGYGAELISEVIMKAKQLKFRMIFLDIPPQNKRAMKFYLRYGFQKSGQIKGLYDEKKEPDAVILSYKL